MKRKHFYSIFFAALIMSNTAFADITFSGMAGGTIGVAGQTGQDAGFNIPFAAFAAIQLNFDSWGIFRSNLGLITKSLANGNIFTGQDATLKMNEISLVLTRINADVKHYFGFYLGTYEVVGRDEFLQRQFGIDPISSLLTKSVSTLSPGIPLYDNQGTGFSYTASFGKLPGVAGANIYLSFTSNNTPQLNIDLRTAWTSNFITADISFGVGAPLQNKYANTDVILLIDTIYFHAGATILLGSRYTHGLLLQAGIQSVKLTPGSFDRNFSTAEDITFLIEPRIYTKSVKSRVTLYNIPEKALNETLYLRDPFGVAFTIYSDTIPVKNNSMTFGTHLIASFKETNVLDFFQLNLLDLKAWPELNIYATPYVILPVGSGNLEIMGQIGVCNVINNIYIKYQAKVGYKKNF
ncbi:hypothetical protein [Treponema sp.]|uniref:hypothetical protein n=1 Tax=Treponema sp. TaxID=166 RepID=UPI00298E433B|nr:hypothetical protein [Treponema sp.]MCR5613997.1 hypothetical protein [Treponema sp.]